MKNTTWQSGEEDNTRPNFSSNVLCEIALSLSRNLLLPIFSRYKAERLTSFQRNKNSMSKSIRSNNYKKYAFIKREIHFSKLSKIFNFKASHGAAI